MKSTEDSLSKDETEREKKRERRLKGGKFGRSLVTI